MVVHRTCGTGYWTWIGGLPLLVSRIGLGAAGHSYSSLPSGTVHPWLLVSLVSYLPRLYYQVALGGVGLNAAEIALQTLEVTEEWTLLYAHLQLELAPIASGV